MCVTTDPPTQPSKQKAALDIGPYKECIDSAEKMQLEIIN